MLTRDLPRLPIASLIKLSFICLLSSILCSVAQAQGTGAINGRVFNPATKEYVRNAEVHIDGSDRVAVTREDGYYELTNLPAGTVTLTVSYTGYTSTPATVIVGDYQASTHDFNLTSTDAAAKGSDDTVKLAAFSVVTVREGNAKAIMEQKHSMKISNIVAAETFGNIAEGNIGEFVKFLPAIQLDNVEADARSPRIRGMPAQYTSVTYDGMKIASADGFIGNGGTDNGGSAGSGSRSFGFEQVSMSSIDAVEVNYTTDASQDADAPAGNINLKPKHAYERSGSLISYDFSAMANSEQFNFRKTVGPDDKGEYKILPNALLEYSNSFFNHRLGVIVSLNESNSYNEQRQYAPTYDTTPTATDPRPLVLTKIQYKDGPKFSERSTASFTLDFKPNERLSFSLIGMLNNYAAFAANRTFALTTTRANVGGDGLTAWNNVPITAVTSTMAYLNKRTHGYTYFPSFEYKWHDLEVHGVASVSTSTNNYAGGQSKSLPGNTVQGATLSPTGMTVNASRPASDNYAWSIQQTGGLDWADLSNYKASATTSPQFAVDGRYVHNLIYQAAIDAKYTTSWHLPTWFQVGGKTTENTYIYQNPTTWQVWNYSGPGGGLGGSWAQYPSSFAFDPAHGASILSLSGGTPAVQNHNAIGALFAAHPEYFTPAGTAGNYLTSFVANPKYIKEQVDALYTMADVKPVKRLEVQGGLRWEKTREETKAFDPIGSAAVIAAGFPVTATTGQASTIPGIQYQYFTRPRIARSTSYDSLFPSASAKYSFTPNLQAMAGYSYTVTRPGYSDLAGAYSINDATNTITAPNPTLTGQYANNYSGRVTYYFEPVGSLGFGVFENDFKNFIQTTTLPVGSAAVLGYTDPAYDGYAVTTKVNLPGTVRYRGMTMEYRQQLSFLPHPFNGTTAFINYTRTYAAVKVPDPKLLQAISPYNFGWLPGLSPNVVNYGITVPYKGLTVGVNAKWVDKTPYSATFNSWQKQATKIDMNVTYQFTSHVSLYVNMRNVLNVRDYDYANNNPQQIQASGARGIEYYGSYVYAGIKGSF